MTEKNNTEETEKIFNTGELVKVVNYDTLFDYIKNQAGTEEEKKEFATVLSEKYVRIISESPTTLHISMQSGAEYLLDKSLVVKQPKEKEA